MDRTTYYLEKRIDYQPVPLHLLQSDRALRMSSP
jgi:hypothetical protein